MTTTVIEEWFKCPWTGDEVLVSIPPAMSATEFCPTCEFPMFWSHRVVRRVLQQQAIEKAWAEDAKNATVAEAVAPPPYPAPPVDLPAPQSAAKSTWYWPTVLAFILLALLIVLVLIMLVQLYTGA